MGKITVRKESKSDIVVDNSDDHMLSLIEMQPIYGTAWITALKIHANITDMTEEKTKREWDILLAELKNKRI